MSPLTPQEPNTVYIVEDDEAVRRSLALALELQGFAVNLHSSAESFLMRELPDRHAFIVLDQRLPGLSGLQTLKILRRRGVALPMALVTSHPELSLRAAAYEDGTPILEKPLLPEILLMAVRKGLAAHEQARGVDPAQGHHPSTR
ncbi:response regulator transcription factor [Phenylobacterium immobile]|uniref:response regulator transcription factor n=1 Tax=Phenylobacterium immobile TaxID=21 RepID=UPI000AE11361|nr:response regulator [Phenylobacterium immobile]